jgi:hypothetical protein
LETTLRFFARRRFRATSSPLSSIPPCDVLALSISSAIRFLGGILNVSFTCPSPSVNPESDLPLSDGFAEGFSVVVEPGT